MTKPPAFQMYARDWLADSRVRRLRLDERGAYIDLLCVQWNEGEIPTDCDEAGMCIGIHPDTWPEWRSRIWPNVSEFFHNGQNARLAELAAEREGFVQAKRRAGQKGGKTRAANAKQKQQVASTTSFLLEANPSSASASASATNGITNVIPADADVENSENGTMQDETWNARLAPYCRLAGGEKHTGNWLNWCKRQMGHGVSVDDLEARVGGLCKMRDLGMFEHIAKGVGMTPAVFEGDPSLRQQADSAWSKYGPRDEATQARVKGLVRI